MKMRELRQFTRETIQRRPGKAWGIALLLPAVWLGMELIPDVLSGILWMKGLLLPERFFFSREPFWIGFLILWEILRFCIMTPVLCGVCSWFSSMLGFTGKIVQPFRDCTFFWNSLRFFGMIRILEFFSLFPVIIACVLTVGAFQQSTMQDDAGFWLFLVIQCLCLCFWTAYFAIRFRVNLLATPLMFLEDPGRCVKSVVSVWKVIRLSGKILEHQHGKLLLILLTNYQFRDFLTMLILFLQIRIREYLQEYNIN